MSIVQNNKTDSQLNIAINHNFMNFLDFPASKVGKMVLGFMTFRSKQFLKMTDKKGKNKDFV